MYDSTTDSCKRPVMSGDGRLARTVLLIVGAAEVSTLTGSGHVRESVHDQTEWTAATNPHPESPTPPRVVAPS
jgi:hypothetical protein